MADTQPNTEPNDNASGNPGPDDSAGSTASSAAPEDKAPKWDGEFDPDRASRLVANLRADLEKARGELSDVRKRLGEKEDAEKSEFQRLQERAEKAERELAEARSSLLVGKAARKYGIPDELVDFITGSTEEEINAKAERLAEQLGSSRKPADDVPGKPKPRLRPGSAPDDDANDVDPAAVAARIRASF